MQLRGLRTFEGTIGPVMIHEPSTFPEFSDEELAEISEPERRARAERVFEEFAANSAFAKYLRENP